MKQEYLTVEQYETDIRTKREIIFTISYTIFSLVVGIMIGYAIWGI